MVSRPLQVLGTVHSMPSNNAHEKVIPGDSFKSGVESYDIADSVEVTVVEKEAVGSLWQDPAGESQCKLLKSRSKNMPVVVENCKPFENSDWCATGP